MNTSNNEINPSSSQNVISTNANPYYVVLPCEVKDFSSFVSGLLGKPQELRAKHDGHFVAKFEDITNIYHVLEQRVSSQNDASIVHFSISTYYDNGQSVTHNTLNAFKEYHPIERCSVTAVVLTATYLIQFNNRSAPEKQDVEVVLAIKPDWHPTNDNRWFDHGLFEYRITHTERTWATDIAGLLDKQANSMIVKPSSFKSFILNRLDEVSNYFMILVLIFIISSWCYWTLQIDFKTMANSAVDTQIFIFKHGVKSLSYLLIIWLTLAFSRGFLNNHGYISRESAILFSQFDKDAYAKTIKKNKLGWLIYLFSWIFALFLGVLSNIIYSKNWFW